MRDPIWLFSLIMIIATILFYVVITGAPETFPF